MIDTILSAIGYSGSDSVVTYLVVASSCCLVAALAYRFVDFLFTVVTSLLGRNDKFKF